jgi:hypothetical protein
MEPRIFQLLRSAIAPVVVMRRTDAVPLPMVPDAVAPTTFCRAVKGIQRTMMFRS